MPPLGSEYLHQPSVRPVAHGHFFDAKDAGCRAQGDQGVFTCVFGLRQILNPYRIYKIYKLLLAAMPCLD